jgi:acetyl-CoA synthetase (ADP-forming)/acetyltransferase
MAFIATRETSAGESETLGVVRAVADPSNEVAEFSVVVRSDTKRQGLATRMLQKLIDYCRKRGTHRLEGEVLADNGPMLEMMKSYPGFTLSERNEEGTVRVTFLLR